MAGFQRVLDGIQDTSFSLLGRKQKEEADYVYENANSGAGIKDMLPGILETVGRHFRHLRFRADSASYDKDIAKVCIEGGAEFFISADQTQRLLREVLIVEEKSEESRPTDGARGRTTRERY